jgi:hypothetical protein
MLERASEDHARELVQLDTSPERSAQLRGYLAAYLEMGRLIEAIVAAYERMEDARAERDRASTDAAEQRRARNWGSPYRV